VGFTFWRWKFGFRVRRDGGCVLVRENAEKKTFMLFVYVFVSVL
jgi:hypothetical protein